MAAASHANRLDYMQRQALRNMPDAWSLETCAELVTLAYAYALLAHVETVWTPPCTPALLSAAELRFMSQYVCAARAAGYLPAPLTRRLDEMFAYVFARDQWDAMARAGMRDAAATLENLRSYVTVIVD